MAAPLVFVGAIALAFGGLVLMVRTSAVADGQRVQATVSTACPVKTAEILATRMRAIGLGDPQTEISDGQLVLTITLPATETDPQAIPKMLVRRGEIELSDADGTLLASTPDVTGSGVEIDNAGMPTTMVELSSTARHALSEALESRGPILLTLDGTEVGRFTRLPNLDDGYLEISSGEGATALRMRMAADRSILLGSGPLPCAAKVTEVVPA